MRDEFIRRCQIVNVVDGDTVDVVADLGFDCRMKIRLRLAGIDAPESRTRDLEEKARGVAAKVFVGAWVDEAMVTAADMNWPFHMKSEKAGSRGKYGRFVCDVVREVDGESLVKRLLEEGHAVRREY